MVSNAEMKIDVYKRQALNIKNVEDADAEYQKYVKGDMLMNVDGTLQSSASKAKNAAFR